MNANMVVPNHDYHSILQITQQGFCIIEVLFDERGTAVDYLFLEANPAFYKQTTLHNVIGKTIRELQPSHEKHWFTAYERIAKTGKPEHLILSARHMGDYFYEVYAMPTGEKGSNKVAVFFNDITENKTNETEIHKQWKQVEAIFQQIPVGLFLVDTQFRLSLVNPAALPFFGNHKVSAGEDFNAVALAMWPESKANEIIGRFRFTMDTGEAHFFNESNNSALFTGGYNWQINRLEVADGEYNVASYLCPVK